MMNDFADDTVQGGWPNYVSFEQREFPQKRPARVDPRPVSGIPIASTAIQRKESSVAKIPLLPKPRPTNKPAGMPIASTAIQRKQSSVAKIPLLPKPRPTNKPASSVATVQFIDYTLHATDFVCFFGRDNFLSNFFSSPVTINGHRYFSVEHYYEAVKLFTLLGPHYAYQLQNVKDPCAAKSVSRRLIAQAKIDQKRVETWRREYGIPVINLALAQKFSPGSELAHKLFATGHALLAQTNPRDTLWAVNMNEKDFSTWMQKNDKAVCRLPIKITADNVDSLPNLGRNGKNLLGFLLMELRRQLQSKATCLTVLGSVMATIDEEKEEEAINVVID